MGDQPSGTVTFLFTDIEGSTRRWEAEPDVMSEALAAHDEVLRAAVDGVGGWLFKHTGDGVCAAFASPSAALEAAVGAQLTLELPVRMGVATGEAELRDNDYFGPALNRAARVMSAGHGGQILLADSTAALVRDVELVDLGPRRLRDLSEPVVVFQVLAEGLRTDFPPLRTLDETPGNLRPLPSSFVGRAAELAEVIAAIESHRLVTITGVGGVGKTRLALQAAAELAPVFVEGVFVVELAAVGEPAVVPDAVASVLGVIQQPGLTVAESIAAALADRQRLLVLDNCEHLLDAAADLVETILAGGETVKVLATSREGLRVGNEHVWTVPSLDVREGPDSEAVALFVERARAVVHDFSLDRPTDTASAVVEICRRLDGIPLAIELAASRIVSMSPVDVRDRLDDRFRLLSGSRRGLERHQTLRHAVQWSYDLLEAEEQVLVQHCSVFAGGFDLVAAAAVSGDDDEYEVLDLLDALVRKSLLVVDRAQSPTRYSMLETIRQFAEDHLADSTHGEAARDAHAGHYLQRLVGIYEVWDSPDQRDAYDWFHTDFANLRAAFRWSADRGDLDTAATIVTRASFLGWNQEQFGTTAWAEEILPAARAANHPQLLGLYGAASLCCVTGRLEPALDYSREGLALIDDPHYDQGPTAWIISSLTVPLAFSGRLDDYVQVTADYFATRPAGSIGKSATLLALAVSNQRDEAIRLVPDAIAAAEAAANPLALAQALLGAAFALRELDPAEALAISRRGIQVARDAGDRIQETFLAQLLTQLEAQCGDPSAALDAAALAIGRHHDAGNRIAFLGALGLLALPLERLGHIEAVAILAGAAAPDLAAQAVWPALAESGERLREALGAAAYDAIAARGASMSHGDLVRYAFDSIAQARASLTD